MANKPGKRVQFVEEANSIHFDTFETMADDATARWYSNSDLKMMKMHVFELVRSFLRSRPPSATNRESPSDGAIATFDFQPEELCLTHGII